MGSQPILAFTPFCPGRNRFLAAGRDLGGMTFTKPARFDMKPLRCPMTS